MDEKAQNIFFDLLKAGLWGDACCLSPYGVVEWNKVYQVACEQSVLGLVLAGIEYSDVRPPKLVLLPWIGEIQMLEQRNQAMNYFIGVLVEKMRDAGIETLLVKGQGIAQCYERPLWRSCGDVDFFLDAENYEKAKAFLVPLAASVEQEGISAKHLGMTIDPWVVELYGTLNCGLSARLDKRLGSIMQIASLMSTKTCGR